ncbi:MAG: RNA pseudouridine synthase [Flavobacteriaceae bacterium]|nr:MAG: RNA pseudouridine synthase [Flavobacteriaceae bacterium]
MHSIKGMLSVLYEDNHMIIVNKKAGDIVQGDRTGDIPLSELVKQYLKKKYHKPNDVFLGVVHRLDRPTSGIVLFAKTSKSLRHLNEMLREKQIQKTYWAVVKNKPVKDHDTLIHFLKKNPKSNKSTVFSKETPGSKKAVLHYKVIKSLTHYFLLEIHLETGRHHQIRAQLSFIGSPVKGDLKYGFNRTVKNRSIYLHARKIQFIHPVKKEEIQITAPPSNDVIWHTCL